MATSSARLAQEEGRHLVDVVREQVAVALKRENVREKDYLGAAEEFIERVLGMV